MRWAAKKLGAGRTHDTETTEQVDKSEANGERAVLDRYLEEELLLQLRKPELLRILMVRSVSVCI